ncbi:MAG: mannose-1-phosphate guanylyltransferase [Pirellulales bacterium]|nr:mannose-1-phosphate guanylyltransferase [Pirellulales bacterium]
MRYALIMAGGSGTRLWPMSRSELPKQLIPFIGGKSLLEIAFDRFEGLIPATHRYVCALLQHRDMILRTLPGLDPSHFLGEPVGRDTLNTVGLTAAVLTKWDPDAVVGTFTADHLIEPQDAFRQIIEKGFDLVDHAPGTLVTFGIEPTEAATGFGYLELDATMDSSARVVREFREKPPLKLAQEYVQAGPEHYLWNSGMFVWRAETFLNCIRQHEPSVWEGLMEIADAWGTSDQSAVLSRVFPTLKKTSVDFAVMEPASHDDSVQVAAIPMPLQWLDIGSWPAYAQRCSHDRHGNALAATKHLLMDTSRCLVASNDPDHLIATIGCHDLIIIHTEQTTLVCRTELAEQIKTLHGQVQDQFGDHYT